MYPRKIFISLTCRVCAGVSFQGHYSYLKTEDMYVQVQVITKQLFQKKDHLHLQPLETILRRIGLHILSRAFLRALRYSTTKAA